MEQVAQQVLIGSNLAIKAAAFGDALSYITVLVARILALAVLTYGLVAAEIRLANIEQHTAPTLR
jgi:hypothetical protein